MDHHDRNSGKEETALPTFTINNEGNTATDTAIPNNLEDVQSFDTEKELARLASDEPGSASPRSGFAHRTQFSLGFGIFSGCANRKINELGAATKLLHSFSGVKRDEDT